METELEAVKKGAGISSIFLFCKKEEVERKTAAVVIVFPQKSNALIPNSRVAKF